MRLPLVAKIITPDLKLLIEVLSNVIRDTYASLLHAWWLWLLPLIIASATSASLANVTLTYTRGVTLIAYAAAALVATISCVAIRPSTMLKTADYFGVQAYRILMTAGVLVLILMGAAWVYQNWLGAHYFVAYHRQIELVSSLFMLWPLFGITHIIDSVWLVWFLASPVCAFMLFFLFDRFSVSALAPATLRLVCTTYLPIVVCYGGWILINWLVRTALEWADVRYLFGFDWYLLVLFVLLPIMLTIWNIIYIKAVYGHPSLYLS